MSAGRQMTRAAREAYDRNRQAASEHFRERAWRKAWPGRVILSRKFTHGKHPWLDPCVSLRPSFSPDASWLRVGEGGGLVFCRVGDRPEYLDEVIAMDSGRIRRWSCV